MAPSLAPTLALEMVNALRMSTYVSASEDLKETTAPNINAPTTALDMAFAMVPLECANVPMGGRVRTVVATLAQRIALVGESVTFQVVFVSVTIGGKTKTAILASASTTALATVTATMGLVTALGDGKALTAQSKCVPMHAQATASATAVLVCVMPSTLAKTALSLDARTIATTVVTART